MDCNELFFINAPKRLRINKWRVKEGQPLNIGCVVLLYQVEQDENEDDDEDEDEEKASDKTILKLKSVRAGVVKRKLRKDGEVVNKGDNILELSECMHTTVIKDMCADCGADLRQNENGNTSEASVPMIHSVPDLKVTQKLAQKLGHDDTRRLLNDRKLVLLVDLDQTVIHTTNDNVPNNIKGIYHFQLYGPHSPWYHTRLRPGTPKFLEIMSNYYELHICTFGARNYAHMIAQLLDPDGKYFSHRILSRDECFNATSKTDNLKALFPNGDSMVCIIDDREDVWNMASNLIQVKPYHFFQHTGDINAPPGLSKHELDGEGLDFKDLDKLKDQERSDGEDEETKADQIDSTTENKEVNPDPEDLLGTVTSTEETIENVEETTSTESVVDECSSNKEVVCVDGNTNSEKKENLVTPEKLTETEIKNNDTKDDSIEEFKEIEIEEEPSTSTSVVATPKIRVVTSADQNEKEIEIEDPDDYLYDLENILKNIHTRFYSIYDETNEIPDLKIIVPKIRSEVLRGLNLVFSGLVPTAMKLELSRAYFIAKSLGANVSQNIGQETTHLVAVTAGTYKVNTAKKNSNLKVVNSNWLWSCAERWEHVDERLFPLDRKTKGKQRQPPAHCHSPEHVVDYSVKSEISAWSSAQQKELEGPTKFMDTINPLLSFSNADIADMNKEFDQFFESDDSSSDDDEHVNIENPPLDRKLRKRKREEQDEDRVRQFFADNPKNSIENVLPAKRVLRSRLGEDGEIDEEDKSSNDDDNDDDDDDDEMPSTKFRRGEDLPSDLEVGSDSENSDKNNPDSEDDGDWNMMGAALEREFLGLED